MHELTAAARNYIAAGLVALPANRKLKSPVTAAGTHAPWKTENTTTAAARWKHVSAAQDAIGIVCGKPSGNLEILDFDHGGLKYPAWAALVPTELLEKLVIERSPSGGVHVGYRCARIEGNLKLAYPSRPVDKADWKAYIETRGDGGQCLVAPSPGYELLQRPWALIQTIAPDERDTLICAARSLSEYVPQPKAAPVAVAPRAAANPSRPTSLSDERPGDRFNSEANEHTTLELLGSAGWTHIGGGKVIRPGKAEGISGSVAPEGGFYCFTTSDTDFDGGEAYSPFAVYAIVEHRGDFSAAGRALAETYGMKRARAATSKLDFPETQLPFEVTGDEAGDEADALAAECFEPRHARFPVDVFPDSFRTVANYYAGQLGSPVTINHVMMAVYSFAAVTGKAICFQNRGGNHYANLFIALLAQSGQAKSDTATVLARTVAKATRVYEPTSSTPQAFLARYGTVIPADKKGNSNLDQRIVEAAGQHALNRDGLNLVIDEFRVWIKEMIPENESVKYAQLFCRLFENRTIETDTATQGTRVLGDPCINLIGTSQADPWNTEMRNASFQTGGVSARIIPVNSEQMIVDGWTTEPVEEAAAVAALRMAKGIATGGGTGVSFGDGPDPLGNAKERFATIPYVQHFAANNPAGWDLLENKILIQAAKVAALMAMAAETDRQLAAGPEDPFSPRPAVKLLDAAPFLPAAYTLVGHMHIANTYHEVKLGEHQIQMDRILSVIARAGKDWKKATKRHICRTINLKVYEIEKYIDLLIEDGAIERRQAPTTQKTIYFRAARKTCR